MIKFFRSIRQNVSSENKLGKYLAYAIGEIILVVIGILIALSINNWNENRIDSIAEHDYLTSLKKEFESNQANLTAVIARNEKNMRYGSRFFDYTGPDKPTIQEEVFDSLIVNSVGNEILFKPYNGVIEEIISTGKLSLFKNPDIRSVLSSWSTELNGIRIQEAEVSRFRFQILDVCSEQVNLRDAVYSAARGLFDITPSRFRKENKKLLQSQQFENLQIMYISASKFAGQRYVRLNNKIDEILNQIDQELKK